MTHGPYLPHRAFLTPKDDNEPVRVYVKRPRGTIYWGGAGLDGAYIKPQLQAFSTAGIQDLSVGMTNSGREMVPDQIKDAGTLIDAIRAGLPLRYEDNEAWSLTRGMDGQGSQFNLIGYSYGSLLAAQTANSYAKRGCVIHHLVLIASPIDRDFLVTLRARANIEKTVVIDLVDKGDPLFAGMSQGQLFMALPELGKQFAAGDGRGHFYYAHVVPDSPLRWARLAKAIFDAGLR